MIGIFDSGIGGLSVFREIRKILPDEKYLYFSDNAHCPYGEKSQDYIISRSREITEFLLSQGADIIVVACNTATAAAIKTLRTEYPIRFIGMEPAIKPAAAITQTGIIGVLATAGTLKADKYLDTRERLPENIRIAEHVGEGFVELVESGETSGVHAEAIIETSLKPLIEKGADTIVLGCTHYPFLAESIRNVAGKLTGKDGCIKIIDPAPAVARHLYEVMEEEHLIKKDGFSLELHSSADTERLKETAAVLL